MAIRRTPAVSYRCHPNPAMDKLKALRAELTRCGAQGYVVAVADRHLSEYIGPDAQRLAWLTGFQGSAGAAAVLPDTAAIFVDGRYTWQVRAETDPHAWSYESLTPTCVGEWLAKRAVAGTRVAYDPWLHSYAWARATRRALASVGAELVEMGANPIDALWHDRPKPRRSVLHAYPLEYAGRSAADKRQEIVNWLKARQADAVVVTALDSIAWLFNIRGEDIAHTPVTRAFSIVHVNGGAELFVDIGEISDSILAHLGDEVRLSPYDAFADRLTRLAGRCVAVDPDRTVAAVILALRRGQAQVTEAQDPVLLPKSIKNSVEIAGHRIAQIQDGIVMCRFLHWLSVEAPGGVVTELAAANKLRELRENAVGFKDLAFETISSGGPDAALVHHRVTADNDRLLTPGSLYLVDSGSQYYNGTTDVTRSVAIGTPSLEMRDRFTRVIKGHIAIARAVFPPGTRGVQLDALARQHLWRAGLDYAHGTGHGIGIYLCVHEGPQRIAPNTAATGDCMQPLVAGMMLSNEPGYYKAGEYGMRIENLVLVIRRSIPGVEHEMFAFETLTHVPIDRTLIDTDQLTAAEREWIDSYHATVAAVVGPQLQGAASEWLAAVTRPLD